MIWNAIYFPFDIISLYTPSRPQLCGAYNSGLRAQQLPMHRTRPSFPYSLHGWSNAKPISRVSFHFARFTPRRIKSFDDSSSLVSTPFVSNGENCICPLCLSTAHWQALRKLFIKNIFWRIIAREKIGT